MKLPAGWSNSSSLFYLTLTILAVFLFVPTPLDGPSWYPLHLAAAAFVTALSIPVSMGRKRREDHPYYFPAQTAAVAAAALAVKVLYDSVPLIPLLFFVSFPLTCFRRFYKYAWVPGLALGLVATGRWLFMGDPDLLVWAAAFVVYSIYLAYMFMTQEKNYRTLKNKHERMLSDARIVSTRASHMDFGPDDLLKRREMAASAAIREDKLLQKILILGARLMGARTGLVLVRAGDGGFRIRAAVSKGHSESLNEETISGEKGILYLALQRSGFLCVSDWTRSDDSGESIPFYNESIKIRSFILQAVYEDAKRAGRTRGNEAGVKCIVYFDSPEPEVFRDEDWMRKQLGDVCESISDAIDRSGEVHRMGDELAVKATLADYVKKLTDSLDVSVTNELAMDAVFSVVKDPAGVAVLISDRGGLVMSTRGSILEGLNGKTVRKKDPSQINLLSAGENSTELMLLKKSRKGSNYFCSGESLDRVSSFLAVKTETKEEKGGQRQVIIAVVSTAEGAFDSYTKSDLRMIADVTAPVFANAFLLKRVDDLARTDGLTGLLNHRIFHRVLNSKMKQLDRGYKEGFAVLMVDVDHFKAVNDTYGHPVGDEVLRELAGRLCGGLRELDTVARYGGEEFAVILDTADRESAAAIADKLVTSVSDKPFRTEAGPLDITVSIGYSLQKGGDGKTPQDLIERADKALYEAKRSGRNMVVGDL